MELSEPQEYIVTSPKAINLFMAGMGSGKTYLAGIISAQLVINFPKVHGFVGANTYSQLNLSTLFRIRSVWESEFGMTEKTHFVIGVQPPSYFDTTGHHYKSYNDIISFSNGSVIYLGSLDNAKSHEGKEFGWAILDETKDSKEEDVKEIILARLRERGLNIEGKPWNPLFILTSPAKVQWLNTWFKLNDKQVEIQQAIYDKEKYFVDMFDNKCVCISSTYHNLVNLPPAYIEEKRLDLTQEQFNRMYIGDPFMKTGGEFYSSFSRKEHVKPTKLTSGMPLHITFDFNVMPYITALIQQVHLIDNVYYMVTIDELCLGAPKNKSDKLCDEIKIRYGPEMAAGGLFIYGDATGRHRDTRGITDWEIIEREMNQYMDNNSMRVPFSNPALKRRGQFTNQVFEGKHNIRIVVDPKCVNLIADFEYTKETPEGTKHKEIVRDSKKGVSYEKIGHTGDAHDYSLCACFESYMPK